MLYALISCAIGYGIGKIVTNHFCSFPFVQEYAISEEETGDIVSALSAGYITKVGTCLLLKMAKLIESSKFWNAYVSSLAFLLPGILGLLIHFDAPLLKGTYDKDDSKYQFLDPLLLPLSIALLAYTLLIFVTTLYLQSNYKRVVEICENDKWVVISKCNWLYSVYGHCLHYYRGKFVWVGFETSKQQFLVAVSLTEVDLR